MLTARSALFAVVLFLPAPAMAYDLGRGEAACPLKGKEALVLDATLGEMHVVLLPEGIRATVPMVSAEFGGSNPYSVVVAATVTGAHIMTGGEGDQSWFGVNWGHAIMCWAQKSGALEAAKDAEKNQPVVSAPLPSAPPVVAKVSAVPAPRPPAASPPQAKRVPAKPRPWVRHRLRHRLPPSFSPS